MILNTSKYTYSNSQNIQNVILNNSKINKTFSKKSQQMVTQQNIKIPKQSSSLEQHASTTNQIIYENESEVNQRQWIQTVISHYREGDQAPIKIKQKLYQVSNSHHAYTFKAIGRVISVFNDDIVYNQREFYYGTGSLIHPRIVLTAAHILRHPILNVLADYVFFELQSSNMGSVFKNQCKYEDALVFYKKCLQIHEKVKGTQSLDFAQLCQNISFVQESIKQYKMGLELTCKALMIHQQLLGKDHPLTISSQKKYDQLLSYIWLELTNEQNKIKQTQKQI